MRAELTDGQISYMAASERIVYCADKVQKHRNQSLLRQEMDRRWFI